MGSRPFVAKTQLWRELANECIFFRPCRDSTNYTPNIPSAKALGYFRHVFVRAAASDVP
jgi:hypothetical protein